MPRRSRGCSDQNECTEGNANQDKAYRGAVAAQDTERKAVGQDDGGAICRHHRAQSVTEPARQGSDGVCAGE